MDTTLKSRIVVTRRSASAHRTIGGEEEDSNNRGSGKLLTLGEAKHGESYDRR